MGEYLRLPQGADRSGTPPGSPKRAPPGAAQQEMPLLLSAADLELSGRSAHAASEYGAASCSSKEGPRLVRLYQVLAPSLVTRGVAFGSGLRLQPADWLCVDAPYFSAAGGSWGDGAGRVCGCPLLL